MEQLLNSYLPTEGVANKINALSKKTSQSQFAIGELILSVKSVMDKQEAKFAEMLEGETNTTAKTKIKGMKQALKLEYENFIDTLPFGKGVANKFAQIASDKLIKKYIEFAPMAYNTLYQMINTPEDLWKFLTEQKEMTAYTTAGKIKLWKAEYQELTSDKEDASNDEASNDIDALDVYNKASSLGKSNKTDPNLSASPDEKKMLKFFEMTLSSSSKNMTEENYSVFIGDVEALVAKAISSFGLSKNDITITHDDYELEEEFFADAA